MGLMFFWKGFFFENYKDKRRERLFFFRHRLVVVASARGYVGWEFGAQLVRRRGFAGTAEVKTEVAAQSNILLQRADRQPRERLVFANGIIYRLKEKLLNDPYSFFKYSDEYIII